MVVQGAPVGTTSKTRPIVITGANTTFDVGSVPSHPHTSKVSRRPGCTTSPSGSGKVYKGEIRFVDVGIGTSPPVRGDETGLEQLISYSDQGAGIAFQKGKSTIRHRETGRDDSHYEPIKAHNVELDQAGEGMSQ